MNWGKTTTLSLMALVLCLGLGLAGCQQGSSASPTPPNTRIGGAKDTPMPPITPDLIRANATTISSGGDHTCALLPDKSSSMSDYDLSPYNASAWFVAPPANMDEFVSKMDAIVAAKVTSGIGNGERSSYNEQDNIRNVKESDPVSSALARDRLQPNDRARYSRTRHRDW